MVVKGMKLKDNDPRSNGRIVIVDHVTRTHAWYKGGSRWCKIALTNIFTDGKDRARGYNVISST